MNITEIIDRAAQIKINPWATAEVRELGRLVEALAKQVDEQQTEIDTMTHDEYGSGPLPPDVKDGGIVTYGQMQVGSVVISAGDMSELTSYKPDDHTGS